MKKLSILFLGLFISLAAMSQAEITFDSVDHDFGKIEEKNGNATYDFTFTNTGDSTLVISNVKASCGCTTPSWTKTPVEPGKTGKVSVAYNTKNRPGKFTKSITVVTNATADNTKRLVIRGEVIPVAKEVAEEQK